MARIGRLDEYEPEHESWSAYIERVELFMIANDVDDTKQVATLLTAMGASTYRLLRDLVQPLKPKDKTFKEIVSILQVHFENKQLIKAERLLFQRRIQKPNETISQYVDELRQCAAKCDFGANLDDALRDRFVNGLQNEACQKRLLSEDALTFARAVEIALRVETAARETQQPRKTTVSVADVIKHPTHFQSKPDAETFFRNGGFECPCCPFIAKENYSFKIHMDNHISHAVKHKGYFISKCNKPCRTAAHFHCLYCSQTLIRRESLARHVASCSNTEPSVAPSSPLPPSLFVAASPTSLPYAALVTQSPLAPSSPSVAPKQITPPIVVLVAKSLVSTPCSSDPVSFGPPPKLQKKGENAKLKKKREGHMF
ncbi:uncharacterized protein zgc:165409 [Danio aesculapii]|uniref:uncharacterized protein zgc:165409 n=1 Tax=Danio aesculapii TaxID=1142201 RepID=UPI0024BFDA9F|nr:uncharacterized protein zgc:165409 [Danio aesculapii]